MRFDYDEHEADLAAAARRLPGPDYLQVLTWLHELLRPRDYVEIGVLDGDSLRLACEGGARSVTGIDPEPRVEATCRGVQLFRETSDRFFAAWPRGGFDLAFVDGLHVAEQVLRDLHHLERWSRRRSVVAVHDTMPLDERTAGRVQRAWFHTGDVWKAPALLERFRRDWDWCTVPAAPTGLTLITGMQRRSRRWRRIRRDLFRAAGAMDWRGHSGGLRLIANERAAVADWLAVRVGLAD